MSGISLSRWSEAAVHGLDEVAVSVLGGSTRPAGSTDVECPLGKVGPHITVLSQANTVRFGFSAEPASWMWISLMMLDIETGDTIDRWDMVDAANEFCNIVAGRIKSLMLPDDPGLMLGLPYYIEGRILPTPDWDTLVVPVELEGHVIHVSTIRNKLYRHELAA